MLNARSLKLMVFIGAIAATLPAYSDPGYDIMLCRPLSGQGTIPNGWDYGSAAVNGSDAKGYVISLNYTDGRPSRDIPMAFASNGQAGWNRTYTAEDCTISFQIPISQPGEGIISCTDGSWASCFNSIE
jgi:hypothetical protein